MALGLALRLFRLDFQSLWLDEVLTVQSSALPLARILFDPTVDRNFPPLHNVLVHLTMQALGESEAAVRLPSVMAGLLSIPLAYGIAHAWLGPAVGLRTAGLLAISPLHVWYSQEARPYALFLALALAALWFAHRLLQRPRSLALQAGCVLAATGLIYTHLLALPFLAFLALYGLLHAAASDRRRWLALIALVVLLAGPQLYEFLHTPPAVSANRSYRFNPVHLGYTLWAFGVGYSLGPTLLELREGMAAVQRHLTLMGPVLGLLAVLSAAGMWEVWRYRRRMFWWVTVWMAFPVGFALLGSAFSEHPYNVRYVLLALPAFLLLVAAATAGRAAAGLRLGGLALVISLSAASLVGYYAQPRYHREDNRSAVAFLNANAGPEELVIVSAPYTVLGLRHYRLRPDLVVRPYPKGGSLVQPERVNQDLAGLCHGRSRVWLFLSRTFHSDPNGEIQRFFDRRFSVVRQHTAAGVRVVAYGPANPGDDPCAPTAATK